MNPDLMLPIITSLAWLVLCGVSLASFKLGWSKIIKMALAWIAIFLGLFLIAEWLMAAQYTTSALL